MSNNDDSPDHPADHQNQPSRARLRSNSYDKAVSDDHPQVHNSIVKNSSPEPERKATEAKPKDDDFHMIKWIEFNRERLPILLQNVNGPCPLLAIANILLLTKQIRLNSNAGAISTDRLVTFIAEHLLQIDQSKLSNEDRANYEHNVQEALTVLEKLKTGIDVNLKFNGVDKFEYTRECVVFDLLSIQLFHGWVIDPQDTQLKKIVNSNASSYNQLVEKMIRQRQSNQEDLTEESLLIEQFLDENRSQLTHYGILQLNETMRDNQLAVFFRNNHFSTIWKNKKQLLLLVSDQGYLDHTSIVFETLTDTDNDSSFTDGYGQIWRKPVPVDTSRDRDLAMAIQNEERRQYHGEHSQPQQYSRGEASQQQRYSRGVTYPESSKKSKKKQRNPSYEDRDSCILS